MEQNTLWQTIWESTRQRDEAKSPARQENTSGAAQTGNGPVGQTDAQPPMNSGSQSRMDGGARENDRDSMAAVEQAMQTTVMEIAETRPGSPAQPSGSSSCDLALDREQGVSPDETTCGGANGELPACAPLANPYVPFQQAGSPRYDRATALIRGTIFPGLDLPLVGRVNTMEKNTPLGQLMALNFMVHELGLYLDTHPYDEDAFSLFRKYAGLYRQAREAYERCNGPLTMQATGDEDSYNWVRDPWPWDFAQEG